MARQSTTQAQTQTQAQPLTPITTREEWLRAFGELAQPVIEGASGVTLPEWRASCGFPFSHGKKNDDQLGQTFDAKQSRDGHAEIFVHPVLSEASAVAHVMVKQLLHAAMPEAGLSRVFQVAAGKLGFQAPFDVPTPTETTRAWISALLEELPAYPHARLEATAAPVLKPAKQTNRYVKTICTHCGYTARLSRKWLNEKGAPLCPDHGRMVIEMPGEDDTGEE